MSDYLINGVNVEAVDAVAINTHSSIRIQGERIVYIDPLEIRRVYHDADIVLITHDHYDHFSPEDVQKVSNKNTFLVVPEKMRSMAEQAGIAQEHILTVRPGERVEACGVPIEAVAAYNNLKPFHHKRNKWVGYIIFMNGCRYYIAGDTDANADNKKVSCDIALVPVGGTYTMNASDAAKFINLISPKIAIPTHYGSIVGKMEDGQTFANGVKPPVKVILKLTNQDS